MKKTILRNYAKLIASVGGNVQKGQDVIIMAELDQPDFVTMLTEECYRCGARRVTVEWSNQKTDKVIQKKTSLKALSEVPEWEEKRMAHRVKTLPVRIYLESEDPMGMTGVDQNKISKATQARMKVLKPYRDEMENKYQWCIASVPGKDWAKRVFPDLKGKAGIEKLWEAILYTSRALDGNPVENWKNHNEFIHNQCKKLNDYHFKELHYHSSNGTEFRVGLIPDSFFLGASEKAMGSDIVYNPNIPSEEVFISPMKGKAEGIVYATKPLSYRGELIEDFSVRFENGKAVEIKAKKGEELLREIISMDENAGYLGECALVPFESPVNQTGILFYNTLFDENACCHLAFGEGFTNVLKDYDKMTTKECFEKGINDSIIHVDFMIGSKDLSIDGVTCDGKTIPVFRNGTWAI